MRTRWRNTKKISPIEARRRKRRGEPEPAPDSIKPFVLQQGAVDYFEVLGPYNPAPPPPPDGLQADFRLRSAERFLRARGSCESGKARLAASGDRRGSAQAGIVRQDGAE